MKNTEEARALYRKVGFPSLKKFKHYLENKFMINCSITVDNDKRAVAIFGSNVDSLGRKKVKRRGYMCPLFYQLQYHLILWKSIGWAQYIWIFFNVNGNVCFYSITRKL